MSEERRKVVVSKSRERIGPLDDGFQYFWIDEGAASAFDLRCIADELDRLNAPLRSALDQYILADIQTIAESNDMRYLFPHERSDPQVKFVEASAVQAERKPTE